MFWRLTLSSTRVVIDEQVEVDLVEAQPDGVGVVHFQVEVDIDGGRRERNGDVEPGWMLRME